MLLVNGKNDDYRKGLKVNLVFNPYFIDRNGVDAIAKEIFEKYENIIHTASVVVVNKQKYIQNEEGVWKIDQVFTKPERPKKMVTTWMSNLLRQSLRFPLKSYTFHEIGVEEKKYVFCAGSKLNLNKLGQYNVIKPELIEFMLKWGLLDIYNNKNKAFNKVYCLSDRYFREFNRFFKFKYTLEDLEKLYQHYVKHDMRHIMLTDYQMLLDKENSPLLKERRAKDLQRLKEIVVKKKLGL